MTVPGLRGAIRPVLRHQLRLTLVFVALAVLLAPMAYVFNGFWSVAGERAAQAAAERAGAAYLGPLTELVGALSEAQSAAVRRQRPDAGALRQAVAAVAAVDRRHGAALGIAERWSKLREAVEETAEKQVTGRKALDAYGQLTAQALGLAAKAGAESGLAADPQFGARDTLLRLPEVIVYSGQVADLAALGGGSDDLAEVHSALDRLKAARDAISEGLREGEGAVTSATGFDSLDAFAAAIGDLLGAAAPARHGEKVSGERLETLSSRVHAGALPLAAEMVRVLDSALREREAEVARQRAGGGAAMGFGLLLGAILLWLSLPGRAEPDPEPGVIDPGHAPDGREQRPGPRHAELVDAHDLLSSEELLHVGRAVRATRGARDGAS